MRPRGAARKVVMHEICLNVVFLCLVGMVVLVATLFILSRVMIFEHEYNILKTERRNEEWLLRQCEDDAFYHEMRHHSTLCDEVKVKSGDDILLLALSRVSQKTHLCGDTSCTQVAENILQWVAGQGFRVMCVAGVFCLIMPSLAISIWNMIGRQMSAFRHRDSEHFYEPLYVPGFEKKSV